MSNLSTYINEARGQRPCIADMDEITYADGRVVKIEDVKGKYTSCLMLIMQAFPYFTPAIKALTPIITNGVDTMATDGIRIFMNPRFTDDLTESQCIFVILHECMHNILNHLTREKQNGLSDHQRANIAADYEVNGILEDDGLVKKGTTNSLKGYIDPKYSGWAFERIYNDISASANKPKNQGDPQSGGQGQGQQGQGQSGNGQSDQNQQYSPEFIKGWNKAIADYNSGKLKI